MRGKYWLKIIVTFLPSRADAKNLFTFAHLFIYRTCKRKTNYLESYISLLTAQISTSIRTTLTEEFKHANSSWLQGLHKEPRHFRAKRCIPTTRYFYIRHWVSEPWTSLLAPPVSSSNVVSLPKVFALCGHPKSGARQNPNYTSRCTPCTRAVKLYIFPCIMFMGKQGREHTTLPYTINKPVNSTSD